MTFGFGNLYSVKPPTVPFVSNGMRTGTNLTSYESVTYNQYDPASGPPTGNYPVHSTTLLNYLIGQGVKHVRFTFSWEAVQSQVAHAAVDAAELAIPSPIGGLYQTYWNRMVTTINYLLANDVAVMIEPWQYNAATGGTDICYQGAALVAGDLNALWYYLTPAINAACGYDTKLSFGIMNEPHFGASTAGGGVTEWTPFAQEAIDGVRSAGGNNIIYIPGYNYDDCYNYVTNGSAAEFLTLSDPNNRIAVSVHNYNGQGIGAYNSNPGNASSTTALRDAMSDVVTWSRANGNILIHVAEVAIDAGAPTGTNGIAVSQWADWQSYCLANNDIITGWDWWAVSENGWWSTSDSSGGMNWGLTNGSNTTASVYMTLIQSSLGTF